MLIGIAYAASIGGIATLIGTPPNLSFTRIFAIYFPGAPEISFAQWFAFGLPLSILMLTIAWGLLSYFFVSKRASENKPIDLFRQEYRRLGPMSYPEKVVLVLFVFMALLWLFRKDIDTGWFSIPGWSGMLPDPRLVDDGTIAIGIALLMFVIPARNKARERLMNWETASKLH